MRSKQLCSQYFVQIVLNVGVVYDDQGLGHPLEIHDNLVTNWINEYDTRAPMLSNVILFEPITCRYHAIMYLKWMMQPLTLHYLLRMLINLVLASQIENCF